MIAETGQPLKKSLKRFNKKSGNDQFQEPLTLTLNGCICLSLNNISLPFTYYPNVPEQETIEHQLMDSVGKICQMHVGRTLDEVIKEVPLTQDDILRLQETLRMKLRNAPTKLECNCLSCSQWKE